MNIWVTSWELGKLTDWLGLIVNALALTSGIILLWTTRKTLSALLTQMRSQSSHQIVEAHKTLFMPLVQNAKLAELVVGSGSTAFRQKMLASMMINHASRIFNEFAIQIRPSSEIEYFRRDLLDLFSIQIVKDRWPEVRSFHKEKFVRFVTETLGEAACDEDAS